MGSEGSTNSSWNADMYSRVKLDGRVCGSRRDNSAVKNIKSMKVRDKEIMASNDVNSRGSSNKKEYSDFMVKRKALVLGGIDTFPARSEKTARLTTLAEQEAVVSSRNIKGNGERRAGQANVYEVGHMVWARIGSHRWWPGQVFDEAFASPSVFLTKKKGHMLVSFFGDNSYGWFETSDLIPFESHFDEKSKQRNSKEFSAAVEEARDEVQKRAALGLTCFCRNPCNFRRTDIPGSVYTENEIGRARNSFKPIKTLKFLQRLASMPQSGMQRNVKGTKSVGHLIAYRRAVFEEKDETIPREFRGVVSVCPGGSQLLLDGSQEVQPQASLTVQRGIKETIGSKPPRTSPSTVAFGNVRDHSSSSSKPPKKMLSSGEKPVKKATTLHKTNPLAGEKKATNQTPVEVQVVQKMVGRTELTMVPMKYRPRSPLPLVSKTKAKKMQSSGEKAMVKPTTLNETKPLNREKVAANQTTLEVQGDEKMAGPTEPTTVEMKFPHQSRLPSVSEMKAKFARFGKLNEQGTRVFWNTSKCQVVFKNASGAQEAYNALKNKLLFGSMNGAFLLKTSKVSFVGRSGETSKLVEKESPNAIPNLESVLKKPPDYENRSIDSITKADNAINKKYSQVEAKKGNTSSTTNEVDISKPMMILLMKCKEIVADYGAFFS